jgi:hypothetical protein
MYNLIIPTQVINMTFRNVAELKYFAAPTTANPNDMNREIKNRLNLGSGCYLSAQSHLSSHFQNLNNRIH